VGDPAFKSASQTCDREAEKFLGGDWHKARAELVAVMPSDRQWHGEARWFRCELMETKDSQGHVVSRSKSMKDGLRGKKPLVLTCANYSPTKDGKGFTNITYVGCAKKHSIEMTGTYAWAATKYPGKKQTATNSARCLAASAKFVGSTVGGLNGVGGFEWLWWPANEAQWSVGNKTVRCYMGPWPTFKHTGSIKGNGPGNF
jgi:Septum formation